jgi:hypothetical protein
MMTDEEKVSQALAELWDIVKCRCHEAYTGRGLHDPDCQCDSTDALQIVTDRIEALTEKLAAALQDADEAEAYAWELEQRLAKTVKALRYYAVEAMPWDDDDSLIARKTLAELEGK